MSVINLGDSNLQIIMKMSKGNPGAVTLLCALLEKSAAIDPDSAFEGLGSILNLDTCGIYGSRIWMLYKDVCGESLVKMVGLLRAVQLGHLLVEHLQLAIDNRGAGLDIDITLKLVKITLPNFDLENKA